MAKVKDPEEQRKWLDTAERENLSVARLRKSIPYFYDTEDVYTYLYTNTNANNTRADLALCIQIASKDTTHAGTF